MKLKTADLLSLEEYDNQRDTIKKELIIHKKNRTVSIGEHIVLTLRIILQLNIKSKKC